MKNIIVYINPYHAKIPEVATVLEDLQKKYGVVFWCLPRQDNLFPETINTSSEKDLKQKNCDCILVFGGDGSILQAKDTALKFNTPILGVNIGHLGFLSETDMTDLEKSLDNLMHKKFQVQSRMLIRADVWRDGNKIFSTLALNDAVIYKSVSPKLIEVKILDQKRHVLTARCDGFVAATPTGSTAYSLAAGGPLLTPVMDAIVITPLNPHIMAIRPIVFPAKNKITFRMIDQEHSSMLQIDGVNAIELQEGDEVRITAAKEKVNFIKLSNRTFYQILRNKMHMGRI
ncbi:MAG: NAD(+)/NADH kinase [Candidatus Zophobacter franzmannii]|nr:NAD(+)/NADH kinase [Candidatus Zophobacter franzmannii]